MIALYALGLVLLWLLLTWLLLRFGRRVLARERGRVTSGKVLVGIAIIVWLGASLWYGGGRKIYYDWRVRQMCAVDGGVKVYERVVLPGERFDKWGKIQIPEKSKMKPKDEYYYESVTTYLRQGNLKLVRHYTKIVRKNDGKVLGESVYYGRGGGDLPGPWHPSGFTCPNPTKKPYLEPSIFQKGDF